MAISEVTVNPKHGFESKREHISFWDLLPRDACCSPHLLPYRVSLQAPSHLSCIPFLALLNSEGKQGVQTDDSSECLLSQSHHPFSLDPIFQTCNHSPHTFAFHTVYPIHYNVASLGISNVWNDSELYHYHKLS